MQFQAKCSIALWLLLSAPPMFSQSTSSGTTSPTDPEVQKLQTQQAIMDAKLAILQDQQKMTVGMLPGSSIQPKSGSITPTGDQPIQGRVIAYQAADKIATNIADTVGKAIPDKSTEVTPTPRTKKVVIYDATEIAGLVNYQAFVMQLKFVTDVFDDKVRKPLNAAIRAAEIQAGITHAAQAEAVAAELIPGLVEGGIKSVIDIIGLFRTDTSISGKDFTPDDAALIAATAAALKTQGCTVYEPNIEPVNLFDTSSSLVTNLTNLREDIVGFQMRIAAVKGKLQQQSDSLNAILQAQSALDTLRKNITQETDATKKKALMDQLPAAQQAVTDAMNAFNTLGAPGSPVASASQAQALKAKKDAALKGLDPGTAALASVTQWLDALQTALFKADDSGSAAMSKLLRAEKLYNVMTADGPGGTRISTAYILVEKMAALTGSVITKTNFFIPTRMYYNGGSIATFTLFDTNGEVLRSGTITERSNNVRQVKEDGKPGEMPKFYP